MGWQADGDTAADTSGAAEEIEGKMQHLLATMK